MKKYVYRLRMMSGALAKAMELGCWRQKKWLLR